MTTPPKDVALMFDPKVINFRVGRIVSIAGQNDKVAILLQRRDTPANAASHENVIKLTFPAPMIGDLMEQLDQLARGALLNHQKPSGNA